MRDGDAHDHVLQVDDTVVGVVGAACGFVHGAHNVFRSDGSGNTRVKANRSVGFSRFIKA